MKSQLAASLGQKSHAESGTVRTLHWAAILVLPLVEFDWIPEDCWYRYCSGNEYVWYHFPALRQGTLSCLLRWLYPYLWSCKYINMPSHVAVAAASPRAKHAKPSAESARA